MYLQVLAHHVLVESIVGNSGTGKEGIAGCAGGSGCEGGGGTIFPSFPLVICLTLL
jgi:hypothetical protein